MTPTGPHQAGIVTPNPPQPHLLAVVFDVAAQADLRSLLATIGNTIVALTSTDERSLLGLAPGDLTVTVGVGPRLVTSINPRLPGAVELPEFSREQIADSDRGGDLLMQICASDPLLVPVVANALAAAAGGALQERWRQSSVRGGNIPVTKTASAPRNLFGFIDGIVVPHSADELDRDVWLSGPGPVAGGTIVVLRRMQVDLNHFAALSLSQQEAVFGHRRADGAPLSGGTIASDPDFAAKTPDGRYLIPADAHARRADPTSAGVKLMLRRSYSIDDPTAGLLFISFQNELAAFTKTLQRMDRADALLPFTLTTASASFLVLPGFDAEHPLGSTLFTKP